jgi:putative transcriptional regulator
LIRHHPSETTIAAYATGTLPEGLAIVAATHIARCPACQQSLATLEATGGALLDELAPVPLTGGALAGGALASGALAGGALAGGALAGGAIDRLLARADEPPATAPILNPALPAPLNRVAMGHWWPIGIGMRYRPLRIGGAAWGGLILAQPGRSLPRHGHNGLELTCVLSGSFADGSGAYVAGDLSEPMNDHDQPPLVIGKQPCLCVIAAEGIRFRGLFGLAQRMLGR